VRTVSHQVAWGIALLLCVVPPAHAQVAANMSATVSIGSALAASGAPGATGQVRFGSLAQGATPTTVLPSSPLAGRFDLVGVANTALSITFTSLPAVLVGPAGATLAVTNYQACFTTTTVNAGCSAQSISVGPALSGSPALSALGVGYLWVGSTLGAVGAGQTPGVYTATLSLQIVAL
jgi:hypothetical protein